jgi:hypothetical protein
MKTKLMLPLLVIPAALVSTAHANWFSDPRTGVSLNIGSAPNPTSADIRANRMPVVTQDSTEGNAVAAAKKDDKAPVASSPQAPAPAGGGDDRTTEAAPSR